MSEKCERCHDTNPDWTREAGGAHDFRVHENAIYYHDAQFGWEGERINICPWCGKRLGVERDG